MSTQRRADYSRPTSKYVGNRAYHSSQRGLNDGNSLELIYTPNKHFHGV